MSAMKVPSKMIGPQLQARRLQADELRTVAGSGAVRVIGVDGPPPMAAPAQKTMGVVELPAPPASVPSHLAELVADAVLARLLAAGATVPPASTRVADITPGPTPRNLLYVDLLEAAQRLGTTKQALKKYLARHQRRDGRDTVCPLGAGARAVKIRGRWRVRFDDEGRP